MNIDLPYDIGDRVIVMDQKDIDARVTGVAVYATGVSVQCRWWDGRALRDEWISSQLVERREPWT